jgi:signal transduction histidine kinase
MAIRAALTGLSSIRPRSDDAVMVMVLLGLGLAVTAYAPVLSRTGYPSNHEAVLVAMTVPLLWRRSAPVLTGALVLFSATFMLRAEPGWPLALSAIVIAVYTVTTHHGARAGLMAACVSAVVAALPVASAVAVVQGPTDHVLVTVIALAGAWSVGAGLRRTERRWNRRSEAYKQEREQERHRRLVLQERTDIARELHDSVAHHLTLIAVQCESRLAQPAVAEESSTAFGHIAETARQALGELDQILNALRVTTQPEAVTALLTPQAAPGLQDLSSLVASVSAQADTLAVDLTCNLGVEVDAALSQAAYRIVQEALTNVVRHANASQAAITATILNDRLVVTVVDDGVGIPLTRESDRVGKGLVGMSERVHAIGGSVQLLPNLPRGTRLVAELPLATRSALRRPHQPIPTTAKTAETAETATNA